MAGVWTHTVAATDRPLSRLPSLVLALLWIAGWGGIGYLVIAENGPFWRLVTFAQPPR